MNTCRLYSDGIAQDRLLQTWPMGVRAVEETECISWFTNLKGQRHLLRRIEELPSGRSTEQSVFEIV